MIISSPRVRLDNLTPPDVTCALSKPRLPASGILKLPVILAILSGVLEKIYKMFTLQQQANVVEAELQALREENASLTSTKEKLEDPDYVQTYARGEYMFSKGDEKVFYLPGD